MNTEPLVELETPHGLMPAYAAVRATPPPWPGVVVIHDFTGMSQDLRQHADWLAGEGFWRSHPTCTGGAVGCVAFERFCMGGGYAIALAEGHGFDASAVNYGGCPSDAEDWLPRACPVVGSFGGADKSPLGARAGQRLGELLTEFEVPHDVRIYPGVGHGFMNDHAPEDQTLFLRFLARVSGTRYDHAATLDARRRIAAFFKEHLRSAAPSST